MSAGESKPRIIEVTATGTNDNQLAMDAWKQFIETRKRNIEMMAGVEVRKQPRTIVGGTATHTRYRQVFEFFVTQIEYHGNIIHVRQIDAGENA